MDRIVVGVLKVVIAAALLGSLVVQVMILPLLWIDLQMEGAPTALRWIVVTMLFVGVVCLQAVGVCIWQLLTLVRAGRVFSRASFRYVDVVIGAIATGSALIAVFAGIMVFLNRTNPGDSVAPGLVGIVFGFALVAAGVALLVYVMRMLLVQAIALDTDARTLRAELDEVI